MKQLSVVAVLILSVVALAKFSPFGGLLTSSSGAQAVAATPVAATTAVPVWVDWRCDAPANAQSGTVTYYSDGGFVLYSDGGVVGVYASGADPYYGHTAGERDGRLQLAIGENAVAVAGSDGGSAHCWLLWVKEF